MSAPVRPPRLLHALLCFTLPVDTRDVVDGDLHELYVARRGTSGAASATIWYQIAPVIALITGSVLLLSAAGIHALMSFTVNQRRREIGIRAALGASARGILGTIMARALRQLALGVGVGLTMAIGLDVAAGGVLMDGTGMLVVPATAAFMLIVGLLAAAGPARQGLRVQPTEALRSE